jgi:hypothetical protein
MTEEVARASIDWLRSTTCRVLALMGGEVTLRPKFVHKIVYYAAKNDFLGVHPDNGRLLKPDLIDRLADAGIATFNLAVDAVDEKPGLPKALNPIRSHFEYLVKKQYRYGFTVFLNINICRNNLDDVKALTETRTTTRSRPTITSTRCRSSSRRTSSTSMTIRLYPRGGRPRVGEVLDC